MWHVRVRLTVLAFAIVKKCAGKSFDMTIIIISYIPYYYKDLMKIYNICSYEWEFSRQIGAPKSCAKQAEFQPAHRPCLTPTLAIRRFQTSISVLGIA